MTKPAKLKYEKTMSVADFFSMLLNFVTQTHIFHLQTQSYAQHMALGSFYGSLQDQADALIESYQGAHGIVKGYKSSPIKDIGDPVADLKYLLYQVEIHGPKLFTESDMLNQIDELKTLLKSTIYKLQNLK